MKPGRRRCQSLSGCWDRRPHERPFERLALLLNLNRFTGDHPSTAEAIVEAVGILKLGHALCDVMAVSRGLDGLHEKGDG